MAMERLSGEIQEGFFERIFDWNEQHPYKPEESQEDGNVRGGECCRSLMSFVGQILTEWYLHNTRHEENNCHGCNQRFCDRMEHFCRSFLNDELSEMKMDWLTTEDSVSCVLEEAGIDQEQQLVDEEPVQTVPPILTTPLRQSQSRVSSPRDSSTSRSESCNNATTFQSPKRNPPSIILTRIQDEAILRKDLIRFEGVWAGWCKDVFDTNVPSKFDFSNIDAIMPRGNTALTISFYERPKRKHLTRFVNALQRNRSCRIFIFNHNYMSPMRRTSSSLHFDSDTRTRRSQTNDLNFISPKYHQQPRVGASEHSPPDYSPRRLRFFNSRQNSNLSSPSHRRQCFLPTRLHRTPNFLEHTRLQQLESKMDYLLELFERII